MNDTTENTPQPADPIAALAALKSDENFMARLSDSNPWVRGPAERQWNLANEQAAVAETAAQKAADDGQRDGSPDPEPIAYQLEPGMMLANQTVDEPTLTFAQEVAAGLKLTKEEWSSVATAWSGALAAIDRGDVAPDAEAGIRQLAQRYGVAEADAILSDARAFVASIPKAHAERVREMLEDSGLANNVSFIERLAFMQRDRQARRR